MSDVDSWYWLPLAAGPLIVGCLLLRHPALVLGGLLALHPVFTWPVIQAATTLSAGGALGTVNCLGLINVFLVAYGVAVLVVFPERRLLPSPGRAVIVLLMCALVLGTAVAGTSRAARLLLGSIANVVGYFLMMRRTAEELRLLQRCLLMSMVIPLGFGIWQELTHAGHVDNEGIVRVNATFYHPNDYGMFLVNLLPLCLLTWHECSVRFRAHEVPRVAVQLLAGLVALSLLLTQMRGAWIASLLVLGVFAVFASAGRRLQMLLLPAVALVVLVSTIGSHVLLGRSSSLSSSYSGRLEADVVTWNLFCTAPIIGNGIGGTERQLGLLLREEDPWPHNAYLTLLADCGVLGLAGLVGVYGYFLIRGFAAARSGNTQIGLLGTTVLGLVVGQMILDLSEGGGVGARLQWWICLGVLLRRIEIGTNNTPVVNPGREEQVSLYNTTVKYGT